MRLSKEQKDLPMPEETNISQQSKEEIDINWLKEVISDTFEGNRVDIPAPTAKKPHRVRRYHAPSLMPLKYPRNLPSWLKWLYKLWWAFKEPFEIRYPHQWNWDSCAHSIILTHIDLEAARQEMELLLLAQQPNGFIPHMVWNHNRLHWADKLLKRIYPGDVGSSFLQPPTLAEAIERIIAEYVYNEVDALDFLKMALPRLKKYYLYIHATRVRGGDGLPEIIISYESKDRSPEYDTIYGSSNAGLAPMGPMNSLVRKYMMLGWDINKIFASNLFRVKDTLFCCVYVQNLRALSQLCDLASDDDGDTFAAMADKAEQSIHSKMYDTETGLYYSLDARNEKDAQLKINTISCLIPLMLNNIGKKQADVLVKDWLLSPREYWTKYPIPVEPISSKYHNMRVIWRGHQTWVYTNWFIERGLRKHGYDRIASELTRRTYKLIRKEGFREYYSAKTGKGGRALNFGWSALVLDMVTSMQSSQA
jgi:hypothetical protein